MINKYTNKQRGLLAVIMAMVMVFAGAAFIAAEVDGEVQYSDEGATATVANADEFDAALKNVAVTKIIISKDMTLDAENTVISKPVTIEGVNDVKLTLKGMFNIANTEGTVTVTKLNITGEDKIFVSSSADVIFKECVFVDLVEHAVTIDQTKESNVEFDNVDFNGSTLTIGVTSVVPKVTVSDCDEVDINFVAYSDNTTVKLGTNIIFEEMDIGDVKFAASEGNITFDLNKEIFTAKNINERYAQDDRDGPSSSSGYKLTITNGTLKNTGFGAYYSATDDAAEGEKAYRNSYIYLGDDVTLAGTTNVSGTDGEYVVIEGTAALSAGAVLKAGASCSFGDGLVLNSSDEETSATFVDIVGTNGISISDGSLIIDGSVDQVDVTSGIAKIVSNISDDVVINLSEGVTLVIADDVTIPEGAIVIVDPDVDTVTIATPVGFNLTGKVKNSSGDSITGYKVVSNTQYSESFGMSNDLESDYTVKTSAFLEKDLTIPEGITLTIAGNAVFDLNGKKLTVLGNLVVKNNGVIQTVSDGAIEIGKTGSIDNKGVIGKGAGVRVNLVDNTSNYVTIKDAVGINFSQTKKVSNDVVTYTLCISGDVSKKGTATGEVKVNGNVSVKGDLSIGNGITLDVDSGSSLTITKGSTITIEGKGKIIGNGSVTIASGASITVDGSASVNFVAKTGKYITANGSTSLPTTTIEVKDLKGFTLNVTSESKYDEVAKADMTEQRLIVSGELKDADGEKGANAGDMNHFFVKATTDVPYTGIFVTDVLAIDKGVELLGFWKAKVTVLGTVSYNGTDMPTNEEFTKAVIGAIYTVEATDADGVKTTTHYIKSFDEAIGIIDSVKDKTIDVYGPVEISTEITIAADQNVEGKAVYTITKDGKLIISNDATLNAKSVDVQGIMVVQVDGTAPSEITYNAKSENKETGDVTYYGFLVALQNAKAGDVIEISKSTPVSDSFTIPEGVTVKILTAGSIVSTSGKVVNMTVAGALVNEGTLTISGKTYVQGTVDLTEELSTTLSGDITVSGEIITATQYNGSNMNGAYYQNDDGEYVYTTPSKAVAAVSEMDIGRQVTFIGKVSDSTAIILDDVDMIVPDNATAAIGDVTVVKSKIIILGTFSGTIIGKTGAEETTGAVTDTTVVLVKAQTMEIESKTTTNAQNIKVWSTTLKTTDSGANLVGSVTVETGILTIPSNMNVNDSESTVTIGTDAGLLIPKGIIVSVTEDSDAEDKTLMVIDGMIEVKGTLNIAGPMVVNGTMDVSKNDDSPESTVNVSKMLTITGELKIGENETYGDGSVTIANDGVLVVGDKPATLGVSGSVTGPVDIDAADDGDGFIIVYASGDVSSAKIQWNDVDEKSDAKNTIFNINNQPYMTVYALDGKVLYDTVLGIANIELVGYNTSGIDKIETGEKTYWFTDVDLTDKANATGKVGNDTNLYYKAPAVDVKFNVSVGFGISLYIDGLNIKNDTVMLSVGTHTVSATVDPGYTGSITISFNGIAVADGKIVVTPEMASAAYDGAKVVSATGDITTVAPEVSVEDKDEGMELTDILLIVLVVLIVIMAIIVALRMMRS